MKKHSFVSAMLALVLVMGSAFTSCDNGSTTGGNVFLVDVSEETDWDYMAFGEDGSSVFST